MLSSACSPPIPQSNRAPGGLHTHSPHLAPLRPGRIAGLRNAPRTLSSERGSNASSAPPPHVEKGQNLPENS